MPSCCKTLYMWIMQCYLVARHYICELCNAMLFSQASYMWIISCHPFFVFLIALSIMFVYSTALPMHQPFELVMEKSGVKTWSSEQTMLPAEADILLVTDSSSEEDSEADDQSYYPPEVYAQTWQGYITHIMHMLYCNAYFLHHIHNIECHLLSWHIIYAIALCSLP